MLARSKVANSGALLILISMPGCGNLAQSEFPLPITRPAVNVTKIQDLPLSSGSDISGSDNSVSDNTVYLQGRIIQQVPLLDSTVYQLEDGTGKIWALSQTSNLLPGDEVLLKGTLRFEEIPLADQGLGEIYLEVLEQQQLSTESPDYNLSPEN
ncbi:MAG: hypothetical protein F6K19_33315 [Cyanothece sp. SIO1E1]|nr:hypothetical protein [Cyanothece sp. SIO1E1]